MLKPIEIQKAIDTSDYKTILFLCLAGKQIRIGIHRHESIDLPVITGF